MSTALELTFEQKERICAVLRRGSDRDTAARLVGLTVAELRAASHRDVAFQRDLLAAEAHAEFRHMETLQTAAGDIKNWRASVWWLERRAPERFARRDPGTVTKRHLQAFVDGLAEAIIDEEAGERRDKFVVRMRKLIASMGSAADDDPPATTDSAADDTDEPTGNAA